MCRIMIEEKIKGQIENMCKNVDVQFHSYSAMPTQEKCKTEREESMVLDSRPEILALRTPTPKT